MKKNDEIRDKNHEIHDKNYEIHEKQNENSWKTSWKFMKKS